MKYTGFTIKRNYIKNIKENKFNKIRVYLLKTMDVGKYKGHKQINLYISGSRKLKNSDYSNFDFGEEFDDDIMDYILSILEDDSYCGIDIVGGDPMEPENAKELLKFVYKFRQKFGFENPNKFIRLYSRYTYYNIYSLDDDDDRVLLMELSDLYVEEESTKGKKKKLTIVDINATRHKDNEFLRNGNGHRKFKVFYIE
jgi:organic radical activating enzyme